MGHLNLTLLSITLYHNVIGLKIPMEMCFFPNENFGLGGRRYKQSQISLKFCEVVDVIVDLFTTKIDFQKTHDTFVFYVFTYVYISKFYVHLIKIHGCNIITNSLIDEGSSTPIKLFGR